MGRSPGLALFLAARSLTGMPREKPDSGAVSRPDGRLVWMHVGQATNPEAIVELARRLSVRRRATSVLLTSDRPETVPNRNKILRAAAPGDTPAEARRFYGEWRPDVAVFAGSGLHASALAEAKARGVRTILVDAHVPAQTVRALRWTPFAAPSLFSGVSHILTGSEADAATFRKLRAPSDRIEMAGFLEEGTAPIPCSEAERSTLAALLAARPVWLAMNVTPQELDLVIAAHTRTSRIAHRLLLILVPSEPDRGRELKTRLDTEGWQVGLRTDGDEPDPHVQIYIADTADEMGLWYRLSPITFLGRSLVPGGEGHDPYEPAALGSAILSGPHTNGHRHVFSRFLRAGAARTVGSADALGDALADLLAPDRAAEMARRAWEITSAGAEVTDRVLHLIEQALDASETA